MTKVPRLLACGHWDSENGITSAHDPPACIAAQEAEMASGHPTIKTTLLVNTRRRIGKEFKMETATANDVAQLVPNETIESLRKYYASDLLARQYLDRIANLKINRRGTTIEQACAVMSRHGVNLSREDMTAIFERLQSFGCGELVNLKGRPHEFRWKYGQSLVGQTARATTEPMGHEMGDEIDDDTPMLSAAAMSHMNPATVSNRAVLTIMDTQYGTLVGFIVPANKVSNYVHKLTAIPAE